MEQNVIRFFTCQQITNWEQKGSIQWNTTKMTTSLFRNFNPVALKYQYTIIYICTYIHTYVYLNNLYVCMYVFTYFANYQYFLFKAVGQQQTNVQYVQDFFFFLTEACSFHTSMVKRLC